MLHAIIVHRCQSQNGRSFIKY